MKILALEFSSEERSVAIVDSSDKGTALLGKASEFGGRSTRAIALIETALREANLEREAIDAIAIGIGPGSYTGIRAAIAVAQGWQLATGAKTFAISSVAGLALQAQSIGIYGNIHLVVDAQRNEFYLSVYRISETDREETAPLQIVSAEKIKACAERGDIIVGPDAKPFNGQTMQPQATFIASLVSGMSAIPAENLEPIYLRETSFVKAPPPRIIP